MNWYKRIKLAQITTKKPTYLDIGHMEDNLTPNYLWVYYNNKLHTKEALPWPNQINHETVFPFIDGKNWKILYAGRYDGDTNKISIQKPLVGPHAHRPAPNFLKDMLKYNFSNNAKIFEF